MIPSLDDPEWAEVFGEGSGDACTPINPQPQPPSYTGSVATFTREDVSEIYDQEAGINGEDWIVFGRLSDGRYFCARAGYDRTGWAWNSGDVASTREDIERFGLNAPKPSSA